MRRSVIPARELAGVCSYVTVTGRHWHPDLTKPGVISPGLVIVFEFAAIVGRGVSGFLRPFGEGRVHFIFLDAVRRISRLTEILFFGAITHHTGVRRRWLFLGVLGIALAGHREVSTRRCASPNLANGCGFRRL